jgi:hypothetical protein
MRSRGVRQIKRVASSGRGARSKVVVAVATVYKSLLTERESTVFSGVGELGRYLARIFQIQSRKKGAHRSDEPK